ncbi:hypothetical protein SANTM175S_01320 [Streptomyces antimycoticus]
MDLYTSSYDPIFTPMALAYQESAGRAGIRIRVKTAAADSYYTQIWMKKPLMATYWYTGRPVDQLLNQVFRGGSSYNETAWADKEFDALLDRARRETNRAAGASCTDRRRRSSSSGAGPSLRCSPTGSSGSPGRCAATPSTASSSTTSASA